MDEDEHSRSASKLAWLWVIEYVAGLQEVDPSLIHGLIAEAPEFLEDLGKDTMEMVALRCLEDSFGSKNEGQSNIPFTAKPKFTFDISNSCEDVLLSTLKETSITDLLKGDMQPFLVHKRTTMPKCSLKHLKDEILEGVHPCIASLTECSGLMHKDEANDRLSTGCFQQTVCCRDGSTGTSNSLLMAREAGTVSLPLEDGDSYRQNLLPVKRNGNVAEDYSKDRGDVGDGDLHLNVKRVKCNVSSASNAAERSLSHHFDDEFLEESFKRMAETTEKECLDAETQCREDLGECMPSEDGHEKFVATNRIVRSASADSIYEIEHNNQYDNADGATKMPQHTFRDGPCQDTMEGEVIEAEIRNGTSLGRVLQKVSVDDSGDISNSRNQQKSPIDISSSGFHKEISADYSEGSAESIYEEEDTSNDGHKYHHENVDVAMERSQFLSSHCTLSHVSLSNYSKLCLCVKCSKGDKLLVCNGVDCPMAVHEKCLGYTPRFDKKGNFYCAFCAYSYAISKYMEAKARAASAKKELARFVHKDHDQSLGKKHHNVKQKQRVDESDETNRRHHNHQLEKRKVDNKFAEPIISCAGASLMQRDGYPDIIYGISPIFPAEKGSEGMPQEQLSVRGPDRQECASSDPKFNIANRLCRGKEILLNEKEGERGIQKEAVGQQSNDLLQKSVCAINSDEKTTNDTIKEKEGEGGIQEEVVGQQSNDLLQKSVCAVNSDEKIKEDRVFSDSIRLHLQGLKKQYVQPEKKQQIKPNRVPWTAEEEEMLKEGVKKFSRMGERIPWTKILEFGNSVFLSRRSAMQLKDKWRNMERKS